jgi:hypothetical protein
VVKQVASGTLRADVLQPVDCECACAE